MKKRVKPISKESQGLDEAIESLWELAQAKGIDPYPVIFEEVSSKRLYDIAAYGIPKHYRHWSYGKRYHSMRRQYEQGKGRIMELVVHANPALAYLLRNNHDVYNKMVAAHVYGHSDFFKHNMYFEGVSENKVDIFRTHAERIANYEEEYGVEKVEQLITRAKAIQQHSPLTPILDQQKTREPEASKPGGESDSRVLWDEYKPLFEEDNFIEAELNDSTMDDPDGDDWVPKHDLLLFIIEESETLEDWQRDVLSMIYEERTYQLPQIVTKVMNEGWAVFWHDKLMDVIDLTEQEKLRYAEAHGNVLAPPKTQINPYNVGWRIFKDIEERDGLDRCLQVRENHSDSSFFMNFLTDELIDELDLYKLEFDYRVRDREVEEIRVGSKDPGAVRTALINRSFHRNVPKVTVDDVKKDGTLRLQYPEERRLVKDDARKVLAYLKDLWGDNVVLTRSSGKPLRPS